MFLYSIILFQFSKKNNSMDAARKVQTIREYITMEKYPLQGEIFEF